MLLINLLFEVSDIVHILLCHLITYMRLPTKRKVPLSSFFTKNAGAVNLDIIGFAIPASKSQFEFLVPPFVVVIPYVAH